MPNFSFPVWPARVPGYFGILLCLILALAGCTRFSAPLYEKAPVSQDALNALTGIWLDEKKEGLLYISRNKGNYYIATMESDFDSGLFVYQPLITQYKNVLFVNFRCDAAEHRFPPDATDTAAGKSNCPDCRKKDCDDGGRYVVTILVNKDDVMSMYPIEGETIESLNGEKKTDIKLKKSAVSGVSTYVVDTGSISDAEMDSLIDAVQRKGASTSLRRIFAPHAAPPDKERVN